METAHSGYQELIFPKINFEYITDIQFSLSYGLHCNPFVFDNCEFFEFMLYFEKLAKQKEKESKDKNPNNSTPLESLLS